MFQSFEIALAASGLNIWLLPIVILWPVDIIIIGILLLIVSRARRRVIESRYLAGAYGEQRPRKSALYINPDDPRLWVPQPGRPNSRTINIGHPNGIRAFALFVGGLTLLPTVILTVVFGILSVTLPR